MTKCAEEDENRWWSLLVVVISPLGKSGTRQTGNYDQHPVGKTKLKSIHQEILEKPPGFILPHFWKSISGINRQGSPDYQLHLWHTEIIKYVEILTPLLHKLKEQVQFKTHKILCD